MIKDVKDRLFEIRKILSLSQRNMALSAKVSLSGWQKIESGGAMPGGKILQTLTELGFNPAWILTGEGNMRLDDCNVLKAEQEFGAFSDPYKYAIETFSNKGLAEAQAPLKQADTDLLSRVFEAVSDVYKELNIHVSTRILGELTAIKHNEIIEASTDSSEWPAMIKLMASQLKKDLHKTPQTDNRKPMV